MKNHYATAIEIIFNQEYDANAIAMQLAMKHPALFVNMARKPAVDKDAEIRAKVVQCLVSDPAKNYIAAVKLYRELTSSTLKDAVDYVRPVRESML